MLYLWQFLVEWKQGDPACGSACFQGNWFSKTMKGFCEHVCVDRDPFPMTGSPLFRSFVVICDKVIVEFRLGCQYV